MSTPNKPTPAPDDPEAFARLFEEMADLLQTTLEHADTPFTKDLPIELEGKLSQLERDVEAFCALNASIVEETKMRGETAHNLDHLTKQERRILERTNKLVKEAEKKQKELAEVKFDPSLLGGKGGGRKKFLKRVNRKKV